MILAPHHPSMCLPAAVCGCPLKFVFSPVVICVFTLCTHSVRNVARRVSGYRRMGVCKKPRLTKGTLLPVVLIAALGPSMPRPSSPPPSQPTRHRVAHTAAEWTRVGGCALHCKKDTLGVCDTHRLRHHCQRRPRPQSRPPFHRCGAPYCPPQCPRCWCCLHRARPQASWLASPPDT